ncbi:hypothetical protein [Paracnuella aquatica]|uniref:hypothetical protein n=1 Tax=Paracnuella aquatica TaxID=2268757 RepID=UPI000DEF1896|nr:hypothetical protein [Paracnuella aquatica]RPD46054.1 hypothetical protein DRJ53_14880 [Paracnuella aquatica]
MKAASISEIKAELKGKTTAELTELCLRMARAKKESKELLTYLLFEADDEEAYKRSVIAEISEYMTEVNTSNLYIAKKQLRKVLRITGKYIKYSGNKATEAELLLHFCTEMKALGIPLNRSTALSNLFAAQLKKIVAAVATLHEDLQYEYKDQIAALR